MSWNQELPNFMKMHSQWPFMKKPKSSTCSQKSSVRGYEITWNFLYRVWNISLTFFQAHKKYQYQLLPPRRQWQQGSCSMCVLVGRSCHRETEQSGSYQRWEERDGLCLLQGLVASQTSASEVPKAEQAKPKLSKQESHAERGWKHMTPGIRWLSYWNKSLQRRTCWTPCWPWPSSVPLQQRQSVATWELIIPLHSELMCHS